MTFLSSTAKPKRTASRDLRGYRPLKITCYRTQRKTPQICSPRSVTQAKTGSSTPAHLHCVMLIPRGPAFLWDVLDISKVPFIFFSLLRIFKLFGNDYALFLEIIF